MQVHLMHFRLLVYAPALCPGPGPGPGRLHSKLILTRSAPHWWCAMARTSHEDGLSGQTTCPVDVRWMHCVRSTAAHGSAHKHQRMR